MTIRTIAVVLCGALLGACQSGQSAAPLAPQMTPQATQSGSGITPQGFRLPDGTGCAGDIARFRAVQDNDLATGHVGKSVHATIAREVDQASALCASGNDGGARASLSATKKRHGYPG